MRISRRYAHRKDDTIILLVCALAITFVLYLIDMISSSFEWMSQMGSGLVFIFFAVFIFISEVFVSSVVLKRYRGHLQTIASVACGALLGIVFVNEIILRLW